MHAIHDEVDVRRRGRRQLHCNLDQRAQIGSDTSVGLGHESCDSLDATSNYIYMVLDETVLSDIINHIRFANLRFTGYV